jgi:hypothetical protein
VTDRATLAELGLTLDATDDEVAVVARGIDPEAPEDAADAIRTLAKEKTLKLTDLELPAYMLANAIRYQDGLGQDDEEFLAASLEIGRDREANSEDGSGAFVGTVPRRSHPHALRDRVPRRSATLG